MIWIISICITTFKSGSYINKCLASLKSWVKEVYEIIICDNLSGDLAYNNYNKNIKLIIKKSTRGLGRNICAENSSGDILVFVDADNQFNSVQKYVEQNFF